MNIDDSDESDMYPFFEEPSLFQSSGYECVIEKLLFQFAQLKYRPRCEKICLRGLQTTKAQTSLHICAD